MKIGTMDRLSPLPQDRPVTLDELLAESGSRSGRAGETAIARAEHEDHGAGQAQQLPRVPTAPLNLIYVAQGERMGDVPGGVEVRCELLEAHKLRMTRRSHRPDVLLQRDFAAHASTR